MSQYSERSKDWKIANNLRIRLNAAIREEYKVGSAIRDLGCSIKDFKLYMKTKFHNHPKTGEIMTWDNWGKNGWHIDHIIPLSKFNLNDREQFLKACHYTNLQPMWAEYNLSKSNKIYDININDFNPKIDYNIIVSKKDKLTDKLPELYKDTSIKMEEMAKILDCSVGYICYMVKQLNLGKRRYTGKLFACRHCKTEDKSKFLQSKTVCIDCKKKQRKERDKKNRAAF